MTLYYLSCLDYLHNLEFLKNQNIIKPFDNIMYSTPTDFNNKNNTL